jgi:hypothetical protein
MAISGYSQLISMAAGDGESLADKIEKIMEQVNKLKEITQQQLPQPWPPHFRAVHPAEVPRDWG